ncbi:MAG: LPS export ABC transporter permease LptF [Pseudomonadota bacterium]|nr:LPS export ABC transporter permease LptF [Pseudomonadota bacterium]
MLFDSTLRRELARNFVGTLVVILTIVLTIMFIRTLGQAALGSVSPQDVALLLAYIGLGQLSTMLALSLFVAIVATLSRMYRGSEMTIWFASGVPLKRFIRPVLQTGWPVLLVIALLALFVWPWQNQRIAELKNQFEQRSDLSRVAPGQFQTSGDGQRTFFFEGSASDPSVGHNVVIVAAHGSAESVTTARSGRIETIAGERFIALERGQRNEQDTKNGDKTLSRFERYRALAGDRALDGAGGMVPKARTTFELLGNPTAPNQGELAWRIGLVFAGANMLLLGVGMSASNPRHASNWNLLFALLGFFAYYNFINLSQSWVGSGRVSLAPALLALHGGVLAVAMSLIWWREHGTNRGPRNRSRPQPVAAPRPA